MKEDSCTTVAIEPIHSVHQNRSLDHEASDTRFLADHLQLSE